MFAHAEAVAADVDDVAVVQQAVDQRRRHDLVAEHAAPFLEALVRRQHRRGTLVAGIDELEEQDGALLGHRQVADVVRPYRGLGSAPAAATVPRSPRVAVEVEKVTSTGSEQLFAVSDSFATASTQAP